MRAVRIIASSAVLAAALFAVGALGPPASKKDGDAAVASSDTFAPATAALLTAGGSGDSNALEQKVRSESATPSDVATLALTYLQRSRAEADPAYLPRARTLLERSLEMQPRDNFHALLGMASLSNASHDFSGSARWSRRAIRVNPYNAAPYGLLGDALFELGHYRATDAAYQKMIDIRPNVASYVRASYSAQFHSDSDAALHAMELAIEAAPHTGEEAAFLRHQRGDIFLSLGRVDRAYRENRIGTKLAPGYAPPTVGVAESLIARDRAAEPLEIMEEAVTDLPALEYQIKVGDLRTVVGDDQGATEAYAAAAAHLRDYRQNGVLPDVDFLLFYADRGIRVREALREARAVFANRPTSSTADALAWTLYANGRTSAATKLADRALRMAPTPDPLLYFHAGTIDRELGRDDEARRHFRRALDLDPRFSLVYASEARKALRLLGN